MLRILRTAGCLEKEAALVSSTASQPAGVVIRRRGEFSRPWKRISPLLGRVLSQVVKEGASGSARRREESGSWGARGRWRRGER